MKTLLALLLTPALALAQYPGGLTHEQWQAEIRRIEGLMAQPIILPEARPSKSFEERTAEHAALAAAIARYEGIANPPQFNSAPMFDFPRDNYLHSETVKNYAEANYLNRH